MSDLYANKETNDIVILDGDLLITSDTSFQETILQRVRAFLNTFEGEYYRDDVNNPQVGVPYYQKIFSDKTPTAKMADNVFRQALLSIDNVDSVDDLTFVINSSARELLVNFKITASKGSTTISVQDQILLGAVNQ